MAKLTKRISGNETAFPRREKAAKTPEQALRLLMNLCAKSEKSPRMPGRRFTAGESTLLRTKALFGS